MNICIGREFGSGGHEIGKSLAEELNLAFYDQEFVNQALADSGMDALSAAKADEMKENPFLYQIWYSSPRKSLRGLSGHQITEMLQSEFIVEAASAGDGVFIGRCADYVLGQAGIPRISIFICAPFADRVSRKAEILGNDTAQTASLVKRKDQQRKKYYNAQTGGGWGKPDNYDLCINSSSLGIPQTTKAIMQTLFLYF